MPRKECPCCNDGELFEVEELNKPESKLWICLTCDYVQETE